MHENIEHLRGKTYLHEADITSAERIFEIFDEIRPNAVFHLAAESYNNGYNHSCRYTLMVLGLR